MSASGHARERPGAQVVAEEHPGAAACEEAVAKGDLALLPETETPTEEPPSQRLRREGAQMPSRMPSATWPPHWVSLSHRRGEARSCSRTEPGADGHSRWNSIPDASGASMWVNMKGRPGAVGPTAWGTGFPFRGKKGPELNGGDGSPTS